MKRTLSFHSLKFLVFLSFLLSIALGGDGYAQETGRLVTGTVVSAEDGLPMPGVNVLVQGTSRGTTTDFDGNYQIEAASNEVLLFSFLGFATQEIPVQNRTQINVELISDASALDEVVLVGYGTQRSALVTGATSNVSGEDIAALNPGTAMEALQGVVAGVTVTRNSGAPGAGTRITIRGLGTINNSNPLYIVDGVAVGNIDYLNPSDIESINVLKDAASAAIYGSRAANGVVLVTTVKGRRNRP